MRNSDRSTRLSPREARILRKTGACARRPATRHAPGGNDGDPTGRRSPELHRRDDRRHDQLLRLPRRQLGRALLAPEGLHAGLHDRARRASRRSSPSSTSATSRSSASRSTRSTSHKEWAADIEETQGTKLNFPIIADPDRKVSDLYDMIHPNANDTLTVRSVFVIGPDKKVQADASPTRRARAATSTRSSASSTRCS